MIETIISGNPVVRDKQKIQWTPFILNGEYHTFFPGLYGRKQILIFSFFKLFSNTGWCTKQSQTRVYDSLCWQPDYQLYQSFNHCIDHVLSCNWYQIFNICELFCYVYNRPGQKRRSTGSSSAVVSEKTLKSSSAAQTSTRPRKDVPRKPAPSSTVPKSQTGNL